MIYLEMVYYVMSIALSIATIIYYVKSLKKEDSSKKPSKHDES